MNRMPIGLWLVLVSAGIAAAELQPTQLKPPVSVSITLAGQSEKLTGQLVRFDAKTLVIRTEKAEPPERTIAWTDLAPASRYYTLLRLPGTRTATDWLDLAELAIKAELREPARVAVANALKLDPSVRERGDAILRSIAGSGSAGSGSTATGPSATAGTAARVDPTAPATSTGEPKYLKSTPEQDAKAIDLAQRVAKSVSEKLKVKFVEFQTPHFIIFTDWDPREHDFLKTNCEAAYTAVSKQFDIPVKENVFVGKLPVFMFAKHDDFKRYAATYDHFPVPETVAGYFTDHGDGSGHMVMWKPDTTRYRDIRDAERRWAYTLTHEFTHAFVARYRTNRRIPRWLNEGVAEVIASSQFPRPEAHLMARRLADTPFPFENLFDDDKMPGGTMYPVMQTMVEALIQENRKGFLKMFDDIKLGMEPEAAMKKHYKAGYKEWEPAWRNYARKLQG